MKIAVIGNGNTGKAVGQLLEDQEIIGPFDSKKKITLEQLNTADAGIIFIPPEAFKEYENIFMQTSTPLVIGSTGVTFPGKVNSPWVCANNFSLGMQVIRSAFQNMKKVLLTLDSFKINIHEIHHTKKVDAPSGTAISWSEWIGGADQISSERLGDVKGYHELNLVGSGENIQISHMAHDRSIFAKGAILSARYLYWNKEKLKNKIYSFEDIVENLQKDTQ